MKIQGGTSSQMVRSLEKLTSDLKRFMYLCKDAEQ